MQKLDPIMDQNPQTVLVMGTALSSMGGAVGGALGAWSVSLPIALGAAAGGFGVVAGVVAGIAFEYFTREILSEDTRISVVRALSNAMILTVSQTCFQSYVAPLGFAAMAPGIGALAVSGLLPALVGGVAIAAYSSTNT